MTPISVSFDDALREGKFGPSAIGDKRDWVQEQLGPPTDTAILGRRNRTTIWRYGFIDFYFNNDRLKLIHSDSDDMFTGGDTPLVSSSQFQAGMGLEEIESMLRESDLHFCRDPRQDWPDYTTVCLQSGFHLGFVLDPDAFMGPTGFHSWSLLGEYP